MGDEESRNDSRVTKTISTANFLRKVPQRKQGLIDDFTKLPSRYYGADDDAAVQSGAAKAAAFRMSFVRSSAAVLVEVSRDPPSPRPGSLSARRGPNTPRGDGGLDSLSTFMDSNSTSTSPLPSPRGVDSHMHTSKQGLVNYSVHDGNQDKTKHCTSTASLFAKLRSLSIRQDEDLTGLGTPAVDDGDEGVGYGDGGYGGFESVSVGKALQRLPSHLGLQRRSNAVPDDDEAPAGGLFTPRAAKEMLSRQPSKRCLKSESSFARHSLQAPSSPDSALAFDAFPAEAATSPPPPTLQHASSKRSLSFARTTSLDTRLEQSVRQSLGAFTDPDADPDPDLAAGGGGVVPPLPLKQALSLATQSCSSTLDYSPRRDVPYDSPRAGGLPRCPSSIRSPGAGDLSHSSSVRFPDAGDLTRCPSTTRSPCPNDLSRSPSSLRSPCPNGLYRSPSSIWSPGALPRAASIRSPPIADGDALDRVPNQDYGAAGNKALQRQQSHKHVTLGSVSCDDPGPMQRSASMLSPSGGGGGSSFVEEATKLLQRTSSKRLLCPSMPRQGSGDAEPEQQPQQPRGPAAAATGGGTGGHSSPRRVPSLGGGAAGLRALLAHAPSSLSSPSSCLHQTSGAYTFDGALDSALQALQEGGGDASPRASISPRGSRGLAPPEVDSGRGECPSPRGMLTRMASSRHAEASFGSPRERSYTETAAPVGALDSGSAPRSLSIFQRGSLSVDPSPSLSPLPPGSPRELRGRPLQRNEH